MNYSVLILGSDINAYNMARSYHEISGKKVDMIGKQPLGVTAMSNIINFETVPDFDKPDIFAQILTQYAFIHTEFEKILLIATNDKLVRLLVENQDRLPDAYIFNYPSLTLLNRLLLKDVFYREFQDVLDVPRAIIYSCKDKPSIVNDFGYPVILKPANGVEYYKHEFPGMSKVYKIKSYENLVETIGKIVASGYTDNLLIQEYIPGNDCNLYDSDVYVSTSKYAELVTFAQIGLEEHTQTGVGNCTVLVNGFDEHGYKEAIPLKLKSFLENIGYRGFAEIDMKYDSRDGKYKVLEINPRQARSSYYLTACGHNMMQYLIDDLIFKKHRPLTVVKDKLVLSFVPRSVTNKYVESQPLKAEINRLIGAGRLVRPLHYRGDTNLKRKLYLWLKDITYRNKYKKLTW